MENLEVKEKEKNEEDMEDDSKEMVQTKRLSEGSRKGN